MRALGAAGVSRRACSKITREGDRLGDEGPDRAALVSVVIPAYDAEGFIERTLASILNQTYRNIEVIVVDDGSSDATVSIVRRHAVDDRRIRLISKENGGVASARNVGILASRGDYVAPADHDDLWHPTKLDKQLRVFAADNQELGLVYTLYRTIDNDDRLILTAKRADPSGWVFMQHLGQNFIGNGSSLMFRRNVLMEMGGYTSRLRDNGVQGSEDFFLQLSVASKYQFGVVREHLVGYRRTPGNMSRDFIRMLISRRMVLESFMQRATDEVRAVLVDVIFRNDVEIARLGLKSKRYAAVAKNSGILLMRSPLQFAKLVGALGSILLRKTKERVKPEQQAVSSTSGRSFWDYDPGEFVHSGENTAYRAVLDRFAAMDARLGPLGGYLNQPPEAGTIEAVRPATNARLMPAEI